MLQNRLGEEKAELVLQAFANDPEHFRFIKVKKEELAKLTPIFATTSMPQSRDVYSICTGSWLIIIVPYNDSIEISILDSGDLSHGSYTTTYSQQNYDDWTEGLRLDLLKKYGVTLTIDGFKFTDPDKTYPIKEMIICYRDGGPDAWSNVEVFHGLAWIFYKDSGWEFYEDGCSVSGYCGLDVTVINIDKNGLHITKCTGDEY